MRDKEALKEFVIALRELSKTLRATPDTPGVIIRYANRHEVPYSLSEYTESAATARGGFYQVTPMPSGWELVDGWPQRIDEFERPTTVWGESPVEEKILQFVRDGFHVHGGKFSFRLWASKRTPRDQKGT